MIEFVSKKADILSKINNKMIKIGENIKIFKKKLIFFQKRLEIYTIFNILCI